MINLIENNYSPGGESEDKHKSHCLRYTASPNKLSADHNDMPV